ncbi:hypothetical protein BJX68DRAFT_266262 [Aspergillus pseudodeflectus]|uniref:Uncharacterized protein n=1 Tax=Aspergillus pseudodeflectus TaxID=176178 RepID=A0ABR4KGK8_9EURO
MAHFRPHRPEPQFAQSPDSSSAVLRAVGTQAAFYNLLFEETGVTEENIELGVYKKIGDTLCREYWECYYGTGPDHGVPTVTNGFDEEDVTDPKDVIAELLDSLGIIREGLEIALISMRVGSARSWDGEEMIDAASLAVLSIHQSVESIAQVVDVAEEIAEAERKAAIMWFLTALFILVPIGGWATSAIPRLASVGRLIGLAGEVGMVGLDLYSMVDDPGSAPFLVFSYILGGGLADAVRVTKAARARRGMRPDDIKRMGDVFANGMTKIDNLMMSCKR